MQIFNSYYLILNFRLKGNKINKSKSSVIRIEEVKVLKNRLLLSRLSYSKNLGKYFQSNYFWVKYDTDIHTVDASILGIPIVSNLIPFAWLMGTDVFIRDLDGSYFNSLNRIKEILKKWFPQCPFSTKLNVENIVSNQFNNQKYGLLFSGGIDSTTSYIQHKNERPNLIMIWGADIPLARSQFWRKVWNIYAKTVIQENLKINYIKTNMRELLNEDRLDLELGRYFIANWWDNIQNGMAMIGITAPLTITNKIGTLLHASTYGQKFTYPTFSHPLIENKLAWADIKIVHDGYQTSRQEKVGRVLKDYLGNNHHNFPIRVCYSQFQDLNCNNCEKCYRSIIGLVLENIDPNKYGFHITNNFFDFIKNYVIKTPKIVAHEDINFLWKDIQSHIPEKLSYNLYNSKEFFNWFRDFDLSLKKSKNINPLWYLFFLYAKLPKRIQNLIKRLQFLFGSKKLEFSMV